jgi:hypothetical protein
MDAGQSSVRPDEARLIQGCSWPGPTAEVLRNSWFHSGDVGSMDDDDYIPVATETSACSRQPLT